MQELTVEEIKDVGGADYYDSMEAIGDIAMGWGAFTLDPYLFAAGAALRFTAAHYR